MRSHASSNLSPSEAAAAGAQIEPAVRLFQASDGYPLHYRHWQPRLDVPLGYVVGIHGIQSHSGWYEYSSRRLCEAGYEVLFMDRRGSGLNMEDRGHAPHPERLINDVAQLLNDVARQRDQGAPGRPVVLMSVSWGGKLAAMVAARRPELIDAVALLYPGIRSLFVPTIRQKLQLRWAVRAGWGHVQVPIPLCDPAMFTDEPEWQEYIRQDSLALRKVTVSFLHASRRLDRMARRAVRGIRCPVVLMLAGRDRIVDNRATKHFFRKIRARDRQLIEYPDARHTLEFEKDRDRFIDDLLGWLHHLPAARPGGCATHG